MVEVPIAVFAPISLLLIIYWACGFGPYESTFWWFFVVFLLIN